MNLQRPTPVSQVSASHPRRASMPVRFGFFLIALLILTGCAAPPPVNPTPAAPVVEASLLPTATRYPTKTPPPTPTLPPAEPDPLAVTQICSPLEGVALEDLREIISNPFDLPRPGFDDRHHGVDFAYYRYRGRIGMLGLPVYAAIPGVVAAALSDSNPYGNALIIETPLEDFPPEWLTAIGVPTPAPTQAPVAPLACPELPTPGWDNNRRSLYTLYAHLQYPTGFQPGDQITCGQQIGEVGTTGRSVNEHLHFETRVGPAAARFTSMAHYDNTASEEERSNYCVWRISGAFQMFDPMQLLDFRP